MGLRIALQLALVHMTGSYWMGGRSGRSFSGVYSAPSGTTIRVAWGLNSLVKQINLSPQKRNLEVMFWAVDFLSVLNSCHCLASLPLSASPHNLHKQSQKSADFTGNLQPR